MRFKAGSFFAQDSCAKGGRHLNALSSQKKISARPSALKPTRRSSRHMKKLSILIADDAPDVCSLLSVWLGAHHLACVHTGEDALTAVALLHFDLVITDLHMPEVTGLDIIRRLKLSQPWVRILAISGGSRFTTAATWLTEAMEMGVDRVLAKPFGEEQLLTAVRACWLQQSDATYQPIQPAGSFGIG